MPQAWRRECTAGWRGSRGAVKVNLVTSAEHKFMRFRVIMLEFPVTKEHH